jgi:hypothetical protein
MSHEALVNLTRWLYWDIEESAIAEISSLLPELIAATQKLKTHTG